MLRQWYECFQLASDRDVCYIEVAIAPRPMVLTFATGTIRMAMGDNQRGWTIALVPHAKMRTVALDNPDTPDYRSHLTVSPEDPPDPWFLSDMGTERLTSYMTPIDPSALL